MDKYNGVAQDSAGNLDTLNTSVVRVTAANSDTLVSIYSSDSLSSSMANPYTLPANGKITFWGRNGKVRVKKTSAAGVETLVDEVVLNAGTLYGTFAARPAAGSADRVYIATDTGRTYYDDGSAWNESPNFTLAGINASQIANNLASGGYSMLNGTLVASVAGSALTIALKTLAGTDPSATDPVFVLVRNATAATGDYTVLKIVAATSFVVSSGSTLGAVNSTAFRGWIVGFNDAGTFRLGVINCLVTSTGAGSGRNADSIYPLGQFPVASSTAEGGAGAADSAQVFYTGTAVASKGYAVLGYFTYETGLATAGTYAAVPTRLELHHRGNPLPGQVVQHQRNQTGAMATGATTTANADAIPSSSEGNQFMSQAITPSSAANVLDVDTITNGAVATGIVVMTVALFQDAVVNALAAVQDVPQQINLQIIFPMRHRMLAATTSATTFKVRMGATANTVTFNGINGARKLGGVADSFLAVQEIMA